MVRGRREVFRRPIFTVFQAWSTDRDRADSITEPGHRARLRARLLDAEAGAVARNRWNQDLEDVRAMSEGPLNFIEAWIWLELLPSLMEIRALLGL